MKIEQTTKEVGKTNHDIIIIHAATNNVAAKTPEQLSKDVIDLRCKQQIFEIGSKSVNQSLIRGCWLEDSFVQARCNVQVLCSSSDDKDCYYSQLN